MSIPITGCLVSRAARGDEQAFKRLADAFQINLKQGHFMTSPCEHTPRCPDPTAEQIEELQSKLASDLVSRIRMTDNTKQK